MTLDLALVLLFLGASLLLYILLAGADFGAGILELTLKRNSGDAPRRLISRAMAPVWEANHVWLILAVVILFVAFPGVYVALSVFLHIPVLALLMGIVARGCAFTFRQYDIRTEGRYLDYSRVFGFSSLWSSFFLGVIGGAITLGRIDPGATTFASLYVLPWLNAFSALVGVFTSSLFAFLAAVYLMGEAADEPELQNLFKLRARLSAAVMVISGALVFISAENQDMPLVRSFFLNPVSVVCFGLATALLSPFWRRLRAAPGSLTTRIMGATIVALVIFGWFAVQYPVAIRIGGPGGIDKSLTFHGTAAPAAVIQALVMTLIGGALLILPALGYLMRVFKWSALDRRS